MDSQQGQVTTESESVRETQSHDPAGQGETDAGPPVADPVADVQCQKRKKKKTRQKQSISLAGLSGGTEDMKDVPADTDQPPAAEGVPAKPKKKKRKLQTEAQLTEEPSLPSMAEATPSQLNGENLPKEESEAKTDQVPSKPAKKRKAKILQNDDVVEDQKGSSDQIAVQDEALQDGAQRTDAKAESTNSGENTDPECLKVCAANLPYWFDKTRIWRHFRRAGEVQHVWLLWDKWSGESRGIAFVTFADKASVKAALEYDGTNLAGNVIRVNLATDKSGDDSKAEASSAASGGWGGGGSWGTQSIQENPHYGQNKISAKGKSKGKSRPATGALALADKPQGSLGLMARGLAFSVTEADLKSLFDKCGSGPTRVRVLVDKVTGESKGKAFIDFADEEALKQAVALNETVLKGRPLRLEFSRAAE